MGWLSSFLDEILAAIISVIQYLWDIVSTGLVWLFDKLKWFIFDFGKLLFDFLVEQLQTLLSFVGYPTNLQWASDYYSTMNYFIPLNELILVISFLFAFWLSCFIIKVILKAIPTVY